MSENKKIDEIEIGYDGWDIYKISNKSYQYIHNPHTACGLDMQYQITITLDKKDNYDFDAQEYGEIYGSGGWNRWTDYKDEVKDTILKDAMNRIEKDDKI